MIERDARPARAKHSQSRTDVASEGEALRHQRLDRDRQPKIGAYDLGRLERSSVGAGDQPADTHRS